ncbi:hypothetical protein PAXINDRAFT_93743 [Paxillus involutus ATCC 200175]|uniref:Uncharacterized protein n=1 Tax=Paxillus involutus ATCC 200175 TaxID=664439 RepID=A0A0C9ST88_PAXIN|nr:hypothetical protein PAXINDRAFT_93743 [Paxillus involutus ATCC 200175]
MPRIPQDPSLEADPDFENKAFLPLRNIIIHNDPNQNQESAAAQLAEAHHCDRVRRLAAWQAQVKNDEELATQAAATLQEQEAQEQAEREAVEEAEKQEKNKKKPKMNSFNAEVMVRDNLLPRPFQYAIQKLWSFEFVELWYFTPDGCSTTSSENKSTASGAYTFTEDGPFLSLKSTVSCRPSSRAIHDHDLPWRQFDLGKNNFLLHIRKLGWPQEHQASLAIFFMTIISHESRTQPKGEAALLQYASQVRREWHDALTNEDKGFNIGTFNELLLQKITNRTWINAQAEGLKLVSSLIPPNP